MDDKQLYSLVDKYYAKQPELRHILVTHSLSVAKKALTIVDRHPELKVDKLFVREAALLHDIGVFMTNAPTIKCFGDKPYIAHGYLGAELLVREGLPKHALVCERHTGTGLSLDTIVTQKLPIPHRDMRPITMEEQIICFADKFFSKTHLDQEKSVSETRQSLERFGKEGLKQFDAWCELFL